MPGLLVAGGRMVWQDLAETGPGIRQERVLIGLQRQTTVTAALPDRCNRAAIAVQGIGGHDLAFQRDQAWHFEGRRNALFAGHDEGDRTWARMAPIIETCKMKAVDPYTYLRETLTAIANGHPASRIDDLMPWAFQKPSS
jgi:hypothetical protein